MSWASRESADRLSLEAQDFLAQYRMLQYNQLFDAQPVEGFFTLDSPKS